MDAEKSQSNVRKEFKELASIPQTDVVFKRIAGINEPTLDYKMALGGDGKPEPDADVTETHITASKPMALVVTDHIVDIALDYNATNLKETADHLNTIQDIAPASSPTFAGLTLTAFSGFVKAVAGVLSAVTLTVSDISDIASNYLGLHAKADDSDKLDGHDTSYFQTALGFTPEDVSNKSTDVVADGASDTKYPSVKAVKYYVDNNSGGDSFSRYFMLN